MKITETSQFLSGGKPSGHTMLDFWRFQYSNIYDMQEYIAESLVAKALGQDEAFNRNGWTLWDINYGHIRVEVKQTSYYHSWQETLAGGKISNQRTFSIAPAYERYKDSESRLIRNSDVYVFCLNTGKTENESNPLELNNWEFYVVATDVINANCMPAQKKISLGKVRKLAGKCCRYEDIKQTIDELFNEVH